MSILNGRIVRLIPLTPSHIEILSSWRNSDDYITMCTNRRNIVTQEELKAELDKDFATDRHEQYMIFHQRSQSFIGTIYSYGLKKCDGYVFVTTFLAPEGRSGFVGFESFALMSQHLFQSIHNLHKIYTEVYEYNTASFLPLIRAGFKEEGRFKEHRFWNKRRWDVFRLAFYRTQLNDAERLIRRLQTD